MYRLILLFLFAALLSACSNKPPKHPNNVCKIFKQYPHWYWDTLKAQKKWGVPISVQMAIIYEESRFKADVAPPHKKLFGFIPWFRPTSARGYAQAVDSTWRRYVRATNQIGADRSRFSVATDFIGWYVNYLHHRLHIAKNNAYQIYLAYHQGALGYEDKSYLHNYKLISIARGVQRRANRYHWQLVRCQKSLPKKHWWNL